MRKYRTQLGKRDSKNSKSTDSPQVGWATAIPNSRRNGGISCSLRDCGVRWIA